MGPYPYRKGLVLHVGRSASSDIHVADLNVSRDHAVLIAADDAWLLRDHSANGTYLDGEPIHEIRVLAPIEVHLGDALEGRRLELWPDGTEPPPPSVRAQSDGAHAGETSGEIARSVVVHALRTDATRIGRSDDNDVIVDDLTASRHHAEIRTRSDGSRTITDLGTVNGTFLNRQRIEGTTRPLQDGDIVGIGRHLFRLAGNRLEETVDSGDISFEAVGLGVRTSDGRVLLKDVSFWLPPRSLCAVVGPSGAGKTTLLNALTGIHPANEGAVYYDGTDLYEGFEEFRYRIGYVPQEDLVHRQLPLRKALEYSAKLRFAQDVTPAQRDARIDEVMGQLGLRHRADLVVDRLSGGQRKRTSVALELLTEPSLLFLDEPTSGLDPGNEQKVMETLRELADSGRTVLVVTHSVASLNLCDRVMFMAPGGKVAYFGPPTEAQRFFETDDYAAVFYALDQEEDRNWAEEFKGHPAYDKYVYSALEGRKPNPGARLTTGTRARAPVGWTSQFGTLVRRYVAVIAGDRRNLALLLLQAPILGFLLLWTMSPDLMAPDVANGGPKMVLLTLVLAATWLGGMNAIREIVKEYPIYRREHAIGLSITAYVASKAFVLSIATVLQVIVLVSLAVLRQGGPTTSVFLEPPLLELFAGISLAGLAAMAMCLMISAGVSSADKALTLLPLLLIPQLVLAGPIFQVDEKPVLREVSYLATARWGFAAVASSTDVVGLEENKELLLCEERAERDESTTPPPGAPPVDPCAEREPDPNRPEPLADWKHAGFTWSKNMTVLALLYLAFLAGTCWVLRRRDPTFARE